MDTFLGRALTDPMTGLPNIPYFCLIQNWEERRARRRETLVRVLRMYLAAGTEAVRRSLMWCLCQELRTTDLIASSGRDELRILLTSPDAEKAETIAERLREIAKRVTEEHEGEGDPLSVTVVMDPPNDTGPSEGPCEPCDEERVGFRV